MSALEFHPLWHPEKGSRDLSWLLCLVVWFWKYEGGGGGVQSQEYDGSGSGFGFVVCTGLKCGGVTWH
jgi:hypothetical protein